ncbi:MAG: hypothetical protein IPM20_00665 [Gammaproteobacteria bacterium]|nr:hypothetical protein [Gammaproteobacteria bacterium]
MELNSDPLNERVYKSRATVINLALIFIIAASTKSITILGERLPTSAEFSGLFIIIGLCATGYVLYEYHTVGMDSIRSWIGGYEKSDGIISKHEINNRVRHARTRLYLVEVFVIFCFLLSIFLYGDPAKEKIVEVLTGDSGAAEPAKPGTEGAANPEDDKSKVDLHVNIVNRGDFLKSYVFPVFLVDKAEIKGEYNDWINISVDQLVSMLNACAVGSNVHAYVVGFSDSKCFDNKCDKVSDRSNITLANNRAEEFLKKFRKESLAVRVRVSAWKWEDDDYEEMVKQNYTDSVSGNSFSDEASQLNRRVEVIIDRAGDCAPNEYNDSIRSRKIPVGTNNGML